MPSNFEILRTLEEDTASMLCLVRADGGSVELYQRRFKTTKPEEIEGLRELFTQLATVESPHLPNIDDFDVDSRGFYTVTATPPPGEPLTTVLERGPLSAEEFEVVAGQLLEALDALHERAIVHGSVRPDYVRIAGNSSADWQVTLHGFGQGFAARDERKEEQILAYRCTAPEQWHDGSTRRRTDVYALGCVLYEALTARAPFTGRALKELRLKHINHDLAPLQKLAPHVPSWMCAWVMHLLAADPEQRPRKAGAARDLFARREAPNLPELPPRTESEQVNIPSTPPVHLAAQPVSAPVVLPTAQPTTLHATSSTIPISAGPHVARPAPKKQGTTQVQRRTYTPPRKPTSSFERNKKPIIIAAMAIVLMLAIFIIPRCGAPTTPPPNKAKTSGSKPGGSNQHKKK